MAATDKEIDERVYKLYGLTPAQRYRTAGEEDEVMTLEGT